jgi:hypothetical protein
MKTFSKILLTVILVLGIAMGITFMVGLPADAAQPNPSTGSAGYQILTAGPFSATTTSVTSLWTIKAPWPFRVLGFAGHSAAMTGTVTFDLKNSAGTSLLTSVLTPTTTAYVVTEASFTTNVSQNITDETTLQVDLSTNNTGTTYGTTLQLEIKRL